MKNITFLIVAWKKFARRKGEGVSTFRLTILSTEVFGQWNYRISTASFKFWKFLESVFAMKGTQMEIATAFSLESFRAIVEKIV